MVVNECSCYTEDGPCKCGQKLKDFPTILFPTMSTENSKSLDESLRCVCPEDGHFGKVVGKPCACNSAISQLHQPLEPFHIEKRCECAPADKYVARDAISCPCKQAREAQEEEEEGILPVIPPRPLPPVVSGSTGRPRIHCFCLIHNADGTMRPCDCNQATHSLGIINSGAVR